MIEEALLERRRHQKDARCRALTEAATRVFAERGYDAATTREVAERAGCAEGLIHRYFGGKRGLLQAVLESRVAEFAGEFAAEVPASDDLAEELEQLLLWQLDAMWQRKDFMRVCTAQAATDEEIGRFIGERMNAERVRLLKERLRRHEEAGRLVRRTDIDALAHSLAGLAFSLGFFGQAVFQMDRRRIRQIARETVAVVSRGLSPAREAP